MVDPLDDCKLGMVPSDLGAGNQAISFTEADYRQVIARAARASTNEVTIRRLAPIVDARASLCLILRDFGWSFPAIGKALGRDHTTVMHLHATRRYWLETNSPRAAQFKRRHKRLVASLRMAWRTRLET